jgi:DNA polymerase-1
VAEVLLLDAFSLLYRAFFALPPMTTSKGEPTSALYGFSALVLKLLRERRPAGAAVALDGPRATFRHEAFVGYKASRPPAPTPLGRQVGRLPELIEAFGFPALASPGFEADDVLATMARELREQGTEVLVVSGDLDSLQCAVKGARVHIVGRGVAPGRTYDEAAVWARFGVGPHELPDWKALAGDPTDEIPGVPGIGGKRAAALVRRFGGVAGLLARVDEVEPAAVREAIASRREDLPLWRDLARLRDNVALSPGARWAPFGPAQGEQLRALFERLEFKSLLPRLAALPRAL